MATKWVTVDAAGGGGGTNRTSDSWTIIEALNQLVAGDVCYIVHHSLNGDGSASGLSSYAETAIATAANSGTTGAGWIYLVGLDADDNVAISLDIGPIFDYSGLGSGNALYGSGRLYWLLVGIRVINAPSHGIYSFASSFHLFCEGDNCGGSGIFSNSADSQTVLCRTTGNAGIGLRHSDDAAVVVCESYDNTFDDILLPDKGIAVLNYIKRTVSSGAALNIGPSSLALFNTIIAEGPGVSSTGIDTSWFQLLFGNNISGFSGVPGKAIGMADGKHAATVANNFHGNTTDTEFTPLLEAGTTTFDPELPDEANNDYSPIVSDLVGVAGIGQELSIGAGQGGVGGGGDTGPQLGMIHHGGIV